MKNETHLSFLLVREFEILLQHRNFSLSLRRTGTKNGKFSFSFYHTLRVYILGAQARKSIRRVARKEEESFKTNGAK